MTMHKDGKTKRKAKKERKGVRDVEKERQPENYKMKRKYDT